MSDKRWEQWSSCADESLSLLSGYLGFEGLEAAHSVDGRPESGVPGWIPSRFAI
jgi:hypothetical protein